jgi:hypothetical protein
MRAVASPPPPTLAPTPDASRDFASTSGKHAPLAPGDVRVRRRVLPDDERGTTRSHLDDLDPHPGYRWIP